MIETSVWKQISTGNVLPIDVFKDLYGDLCCLTQQKLFGKGDIAVTEFADHPERVKGLTSNGKIRVLQSDLTALKVRAG